MSSTINAMYCLHRLVNVQFQQFNSQSFIFVPLSITPAHFYVLCGLLLEYPPEPRSERVVTATASRVAVLSVPEGVVGVPLLGTIWRPIVSSRFTVEILSYKWWWAGSWVSCTWAVTTITTVFMPPCCICPNMVASILRPVCDWQSRHIGMVDLVLTITPIIPEATWTTWSKCSSLPTHLLVAEVVGGEDHRVTRIQYTVSWPTHSEVRMWLTVQTHRHGQ